MTKEFAIERLRALREYSHETGVKTSRAQSSILEKFKLEEQTEIIRLSVPKLGGLSALFGKADEVGR